MNILVSKCLLGINCRYKGDNCRCEKVVELGKENNLIPVCPEEDGGLPTPRDPSEIVGNKVLSNKGKDVTKEYQKGAELALKAAKENHIDYAVLKKNSPSCGKGIIYDGSFTGKKIPGNGVTVKLLLENGFTVLTEDEI